jgi:L-ascorbate metabolism protein UlaG (beta-lactamase superfamily)
MAVSFQWLGHAASILQIDNTNILIDPFLTGNPLAAMSADEVPADFILVSHGHGDHVGDTVDIAKRTGATVVSNFEIATWLGNQGVEKTEGLNTGGTWHGPGFDVRLTIAEHGSALPDGSDGGRANGFMFNVQGMRIYFAADTDLFTEMQLYGEEGIDVAMLPIGDHFTMGIERSIKAIQWLKPRLVFPLHYNTFPPITQNAKEWAEMVNNQTQATPIVLDPGGVYRFSGQQ